MRESRARRRLTATSAPACGDRATAADAGESWRNSSSTLASLLQLPALTNAPTALTETANVRYQTGRAPPHLVHVLLPAFGPLCLLHLEARFAGDVSHQV